MDPRTLECTIETVPQRDDAGDLYIVGRVLQGSVVRGVTTQMRSPLCQSIALDDARGLASSMGLSVTRVVV
jgi:hypothetical protein